MHSVYYGYPDDIELDFHAGIHLSHPLLPHGYPAEPGFIINYPIAEQENVR
jgi:hypothetical protein